MSGGEVILLVKQEISGRALLLQFQQIMIEFGSIIPWLQNVDLLHFVTSGQYFKRRLYEMIGCAQGSIAPYQLISSDAERNYIGGILHFTSNPESFLDPVLNKLMKELVLGGASYITCLQVREVKRGCGHGNDILLRSIKRILKKWTVVWAVCEPNMVYWYKSFGATVLNEGKNDDNLAIIAWGID